MSKTENPTEPKCGSLTDVPFPVGIGGTFQIVAARVERQHPTAYRMVRRGQEYVLQGCFMWRQGTSSGAEWRDIPTIVEQEGV